MPGLWGGLGWRDVEGLRFSANVWVGGVWGSPKARSQGFGFRLRGVFRVSGELRASRKIIVGALRLTVSTKEINKNNISWPQKKTH